MNLYEKYQSIRIMQVGTGGTGSYLVLPLAKFLNSLKKTRAYNDIKYYLIDNDIVEEKNIWRQNFNYNEIGQNKSEVLANRSNSGLNLKKNELCIFS